MKDFGGKLAVITGGGTGMGRELARQLVAEGCDVAICDVIEQRMAETCTICEDEAPQGVRISTHVCDVANEDDVVRFRTEVDEEHGRGYINLLFNNAGVAAPVSFLQEDNRDIWERTFNICWFGVYYCSRAFVPLLVASEEGHLVNTSSVNGFWATLGPDSTHSAYSAAKFAVKGFTEALINDFRVNAPHVKVSVVMPGHIGTSIASNTLRVLASGEAGDDAGRIKAYLEKQGVPLEGISAHQLMELMEGVGTNFRENAPTTAESAARGILQGVKDERWRILLGHDAEVLDRLVRENPESAYTPEFMEKLRAETPWGLS